MAAITAYAPLAARVALGNAAPLRRVAVRAAPAVASPVQAFFSPKKPAEPVKSNAVQKRRQVAQTINVTLPGIQSKNAKGLKFELGFTKNNELFVGRLAMLGFSASLIGELLTGKGALAQFDVETGLPLGDTEPLVLMLVLFNVLAAIAPASGKFVVEEEEYDDRLDGPLQDPSIPFFSKQGLGLSGGFGFTKENELFVGRVAQLGFAASLVGEAVTGKGPLAQFDIETGLPLTETEPLLLAFIAFFLLAAVNEGRGRFVKDN